MNSKVKSKITDEEQAIKESIELRRKVKKGDAKALMELSYVMGEITKKEYESYLETEKWVEKHDLE